jgi:hypothetical protein
VRASALALEQEPARLRERAAGVAAVGSLEPLGDDYLAEVLALPMNFDHVCRSYVVDGHRRNHHRKHLDCVLGLTVR